MTQELKPCPFCGGAAYIEQRGTPRQSCIVECGSCGLRHDSGDEGDRCGTSWNRRALATPAPLSDEPVATVRSAYVDWDLVERMRCGEEIDSEEAGMIGAMLDSQADEIAALRAALTTPPATPSDKQEATPIYQTWDDQKQAWLDQPEDYYRLRLPSNRRIVYAAPLAQSAEQNRIDAERAAWSAITGEAAAYIEDAANCLRDPDAKRAAEGAAEFVRKRRREILQDKGASK